MTPSSFTVVLKRDSSDETFAVHVISDREKLSKTVAQKEDLRSQPQTRQLNATTQSAEEPVTQCSKDDVEFELITRPVTIHAETTVMLVILQLATLTDERNVFPGKTT